MDERFLQQLKKGVLPLCILFAIRREARYGYEIMGEVRAVFPDVYDGSILYRLEDDGLIEAVWQQESGRAAPRKIYSATEKGREENERRLGLWAEFRTAVDRFCGEDAEHE